MASFEEHVRNALDLLPPELAHYFGIDEDRIAELGYE